MTSDPINRRLGVLISGRGSNLQALIDAIARRPARRVDRRRDFQPRGCRRAWSARGAPGSRRSVCQHRALAVPRRLRPRARQRAARTRRRARVPRRLHAPGRSPLHRGVSQRASSTSIRRCCPRSRASMRSGRRFEHGVKVSGVTVHLVTAELDGGPIVVQRAVPVTRRRHGRLAGGAHPRRGASRLSRSGADGARRRLAVDGRRFVRPRSPTSAASVTTATSGGQLIRTGT